MGLAGVCGNRGSLRRAPGDAAGAVKGAEVSPQRLVGKIAFRFWNSRRHLQKTANFASSTPMVEESEELNKLPDFNVPWLWRWLEADFSWAGLSKKAAWPRDDGGTLQDYLRRLSRGQPDEQLAAQGALVECSQGGLFHVLFIPEEWAGSIAAISSDELLRLKQYYWSKLFEVGGIREHFRGSITGAHLPTDIEERLVSSFATSFEWIRFASPLRNVPRQGDRSFTYCSFAEKIYLYGAVNKAAGTPTLHFTWCDFQKPIAVSEFTGLELLDINGSALNEGIDISDSTLNVLRINDCILKLANMYDSQFTGAVSMGASSVDDIEWMNCTFEDNVLLVDLHINKSAGLRGCDFKNRVTLSTIEWPSSVYKSASASGSKFDGIVEIEGGKPPPVQLFQEAEFRSKVSLNWFSDHEKRASFEKELAAEGSRSDASFSLPKHAQDIESGSRTLRKVAEAAGDVHSEHLWHRVELIARRARGESAPTEKVFSYLYGSVADYGLSISRPFLALVASTLCFALFYAWLGGESWTGSLDLPSVSEGLGYSLNRTFPIGVFVDDGDAWRQELLGSGGRFGSIAIRTIATLQTVLSAVFIYLGVMAIRRKFRIS
jgi:hypothetical protein